METEGDDRCRLETRMRLRGPAILKARSSYAGLVVALNPVISSRVGQACVEKIRSCTVDLRTTRLQ